MNPEVQGMNDDFYLSDELPLNNSSISDTGRNLSPRNSTRTRSIKPQKTFSSDYQLFHDDEQTIPTAPNPGDIIQLSDGTRKKYNGSSWRRLCSKPNCSYYTQSNGLCKPHLAAMKKRQSSSSKDQDTVPLEPSAPSSSSAAPAPPKKGDIITLPNGIRKKFDGRQYRRICADPNCVTVVHGSLEYQNGMCPHHYHEYRARSNSQSISSADSSPTRKRRRVASPSTTMDTASSIPKSTHRMNIAAIPPTVDLQHPKKGDIIQMENGSRKKFDGVVWRKICSIPDCFIAAQRNELCRKHFIKLNGRPTLMSNHDRLASLSMVPPVPISLSSLDEKSAFSMKDESQENNEDEGEGIDQYSGLSDHEFHESNGHDSMVEAEDSDAQLDHSLINSLSASREKFPTNHLKRWLREHRHHPYPTNQEKLELAQQSSITYDQVNTWFNNARAILRRRQAKLRHSFDHQQDEETERPEPIPFQDPPVRVDSKSNHRIHRPLPLFNGVCCRSIGIQCHPSTVNQSTGISDEISSINDDELRHDRTIRILTPSIRNVKSPILKRRRSQEFLSNGMKIEHPFKDDTIVVTSTCLDDDQMGRLRDFCSKFNIELRPTVDEHTTHLITDEEEGETLVCPLSKKVIQAVARHMYIVTYRWIDACLKANEIMHEKAFEIQGDLTLSSDHHGMQRSRMSIYPLNLPRSYLMENYSIMIKCDGCQEMMNTDELIELVQLSGARYTTDSHFSRSHSSIIRVVLCEKDYLIHRQEMYEKCVQAGVHFLTPEWFLESLVQYRIQPFQEYQISP